MNINEVFISPINFLGNYAIIQKDSDAENQQQTNNAFSNKWDKVLHTDDIAAMESFQKEWYLKLYGFETEQNFAAYLQQCKIIVDAGCGTGYKAAWMASLAPQAAVLAYDFSDSVMAAAATYKEVKNLFFIKGDIANTNLKPHSIDYISCDQVIHHTQNPIATFAHLSEVLKKDGQFACYVYAKKALPRELVDTYFRTATHAISNQQMWEMSKQLTQLGKTLSELNVSFTAPDIPLLGIKGGEYDLQRFIYWNFLKCFWKPEWNVELSDSTNFDWYAPSNATTYTKQQFELMALDNKLQIVFSHTEEACHTARFKK